MLSSLWGAHVTLFLYENPSPVGGTQDLEGAIGRDTSRAFLWNSPHSSSEMLLWPLSSLLGREKLLQYCGALWPIHNLYLTLNTFSQGVCFTYQPQMRL